MSHFEQDSERLVEEFFAEHRRRVEDLSADEVTWARIRDRHRGSRRGGRRGTVAGLVAAAAAVGIGAFALWPQLTGGDEPNLAGPATTTPTSADPTSTEDPTDSPTTVPSEGPTQAPTSAPTGTDAPTVGPSDLPTLSADAALTDVGGSGDSLWALVVQDECGQREPGCSLLVRSESGAEGPWEPVQVLEDLRGVGASRLTVADATTGWVWGAEGMFVTRDGGRTFAPVAHAGTVVRAVAVLDGRLAVVTATDCQEQNGCADLRVAVTTPEDTDLVDDALPLGEDALVRFGEVTLTLGPDAVYVGTEDPEVSAAAETKVLNGLFRVQEGTVETVAPPPDCDAGPRALAASPGTAGLLHVACPVVGSDGDVAVVSSELGGRTWMDWGEGYAAPYARLHLVATAQDTLVWVSPDEMLVSTDGGRSFTEPPEPLPLTSGSLRHLVVDGDVVHAVPEPTTAAPGGPPGFWSSEDGGLSWLRVDLTG